MSDASMEVLEAHAASDYKYGWSSDIETDTLPPGLNEDVVRFISAKKDEPQWLLDYRLEAYRVWRGMTEPTWVNVDYKPIDFEAISYYAAPVEKPKLNSLDEVENEKSPTLLWDRRRNSYL